MVGITLFVYETITGHTISKSEIQNVHVLKHENECKKNVSWL